MAYSRIRIQLSGGDRGSALTANAAARFASATAPRPRRSSPHPISRTKRHSLFIDLVRLLCYQYWRLEPESQQRSVDRQQTYRGHSRSAAG